MTQRAALYLRQSKADDEGIERQRERTTALAVARGWTVVETFIDDDVSASKPRGPETAWGRLLSASAEIDVVIGVDLDRVVRTTRDLNTLIDHGLMLTTVDGEIDLTTADGEFRASMLASIARFEVRRKGERQQRASDQRASKGMPTMRPGYGYRRVEGRDVIFEAEATLIREAARRVLDGASLRGIAADFNARGIPSPRTEELDRKALRDKTKHPAPIPWQGITLRQLIRRPSLAGLRTHRGAVVGKFNPELHPAILDEDTHTRLEALLTDPSRAQGTGGRTPVHLLSGLAVCGRCGGRMKRIPGWTPKPGQKSKPVKAAYACGDCHKVRRIQEPVDDFVTEVILRRLEQPDATQLFSRGDAGAAQQARDAIDVIDARLATAADQFAEGVLTGDQLRRITERLRADRAAHEHTVAESMPARVPVNAVGPLARQTWVGLHIDSQRAIIDALAEVVIDPAGSGRPFDPDLIRIEWRS